LRDFLAFGDSLAIDFFSASIRLTTLSALGRGFALMVRPFSAADLLAGPSFECNRLERDEIRLGRILH
jgi:hypothetical protein